MSNTKNFTDSSQNGDTVMQSQHKDAPLFDFKSLKKTIDRLGMQNPRKANSRAYIQFSKEMVKQYIASPGTNADNLREVSRFLARVSMLYKKILSYYATIPMWNYNVSYAFDFTRPDSKQKMLGDYQDALRMLQGVNMRHDFPNAVATAMRDGVYCGFVYQLESEHFFLQMLDPKYYKLIGKNAHGQWVVAFNAAFFDSGNNKQFIGMDVDGSEATWDKVFVEGYKQYQQDKQNCQWFELPTERTCVLLAGWDDDFEAPLPYFMPLFISLLDLLDLEQILMSKTELENYALLFSKIPLLDSPDQVDDYAVFLDTVQAFQQLIDSAVPDLVGTAYGPFEIEPIQFNHSNTSDETDKLQQAMNTLFSNAGISKLVVAGGSSTNSVGLKHSIQNDEATAFVYLDRIESWLRFFLSLNGFENFIFSFHRQSYFNKDEFITRAKDFATLGGSAMDYYTAQGMTPYEAYNKILTEAALDVKSMMVPLQSSYTQSMKSEGGAPTKSEDELSDEGIDTRDANKNEGTRAEK